MLRISLRELLVLVALVAVAIVSLKYASDVWLALVAAITMLTFLWAIVVAAVDRGRRQAFAIGFALMMAGYALFLMSGRTDHPNVGSRNIELDQWEGKLPTTLLLRYVHIGMDASKWVDHRTGAELPNYDAAKDAASMGGGFGGGGFPTARLVESPPRELFMPIGHCWWALLLGYLGGKFAVFVYSRRLREQKSLATQLS